MNEFEAGVVRDYEPIVRTTIRKLGYDWRRDEVDDMMQEGAVAVLYAARNYDASRGRSFRNCAIHSIRWRLMKFIYERNGRFTSQMSRMMRVREAYESGVPKREIPALLGLRPATVESDLVCIYATEFSLDAGGTSNDDPPDEYIAAPEEAWDGDEVALILRDLDLRERRMLLMVAAGYGTDEIAAKFGLTRERVRQILAQARANLAQDERFCAIAREYGLDPSTIKVSKPRKKGLR